jgi:hypothetical protein
MTLLSVSALKQDDVTNNDVNINVTGVILIAEDEEELFLVEWG